MHSFRISRKPRLTPIGGAAALASIAVATLLGIEVARLTAAEELAEDRLETAEVLAPEFPPVLLSAAMAGVGKAASNGRLPDEATMERLRELSRLTPLNPHPYLVEAAIAQKAGNLRRAELLLLEARRLSPRSPAARYLLADLALRDNRVAQGLEELAALARLVRGSAIELIPALAQYAKTPGAARELERVLQSNPRLRQPLLTALAADPDNEALILELAGPAARAEDRKPPNWQARLLGAMIARQDYGRAYALWRRLSGIRAGPRPLLFNGEFRAMPAPAPFNWSFASTGAGFAEPGNGSMRVLHYGRESVALASQLLLLPPGRYRLVAPVAGEPVPGALSWVLTCPGARALAKQDLAVNARLVFEVPDKCPAQALDLKGWQQDMPKESDVRVGPARIERIGS